MPDETDCDPTGSQTPVRVRLRLRACADTCAYVQPRFVHVRVHVRVGIRCRVRVWSAHSPHTGLPGLIGDRGDPNQPQTSACSAAHATRPFGITSRTDGLASGMF